MPCPKASGYFRKRRCASARKRRFQAPKTQVFENGLQNRVFENVGLPFSFRRTKTEVFEYDDFIHHKAHGLLGMPSISIVDVDGRKRFEYAPCGRIFLFENRKNSSFSKIYEYVWTGSEMAKKTIKRSIAFKFSLKSIFLKFDFHEA